jgi:two-component system, OmpR family, KDP operon response regulator KdpE
VSAPSPVILLIEDEPQMRRFLRSALAAADVHLVEATTVREGLAQAAGRRPDLILLDLGLPDGSGIDLTRRLREWSTVPVIVISARGQEQDKVAALDAGADDYLTKPFGVDELLARIRVALRHQSRVPNQPEPVVTSKGIRIDLAARSVTRDGEEIRLTPTEYRLLATMVRHAGKILTHSLLLKEVWGPGAQSQNHYLRVYINQLRHKLEPDPSRPELILTEPGVGYRLRAE